MKRFGKDSAGHLFLPSCPKAKGAFLLLFLYKMCNVLLKTSKIESLQPPTQPMRSSLALLLDFFFLQNVNWSFCCYKLSSSFIYCECGGLESPQNVAFDCIENITVIKMSNNCCFIFRTQLIESPKSIRRTDMTLFVGLGFFGQCKICNKSHFLGAHR